MSQFKQIRRKETKASVCSEGETSNSQEGSLLPRLVVTPGVGRLGLRRNRALGGIKRRLPRDCVSQPIRSKPGHARIPHPCLDLPLV